MTIETELQHCKILICDESAEDRQLFASLLEGAGMRYVEAICGPGRVLPTLNSHGPFDLLVLALDGPQWERGRETIRALHQVRPGEADLPVLALTEGHGVEAWAEALDAGAADFARKPLRQVEVLLRVRNLLRIRQSALRHQQIDQELEEKVRTRTEELVRASETFVRKLATICEVRDSGTGMHILRIGKYVRVIGEAMGLPQDACSLIERAAPLHDVGKIAVPEEILLKPGRLSASEFEHVKEHASAGQRLLAEHDSQMLKVAATIAANHHERWDGSGYPNGLRGEMIPLEARLTAICDVFDVLTSRRHYKDPWSVQNAIDYLVSEAGRQFDPQLVDLFVRSIDRIERIRETYQDLPETVPG